MKHPKDSMKSRLAIATLLALGGLAPLSAQAQLPARFYLHSLAGGNAVPLIFESMSGNTNPFDPAHTVMPGADFDSTVAMAGYAQTFEIQDRAALVAILLPMGRISGNATLGGLSFNESTSGFGDPTLEIDINLIGPPAQKNIPDAMRYEPGFSLDLLADLALPIGEYDNGQALNIGQNRWYGRVGMPVTWQIGSWAPGRRTTLEFLPSLWLFGDNDDYVGQTLETDPIFQLDAHLTRDFSEQLWGSIDATWGTGGQATVNGVQGDEIDNLAVGLTLGYAINDNINLTFSYKSTVNDDGPGDMSMDSFGMTLVFGWHPLIEGFKRLKEEK